MYQGWRDRFAIYLGGFNSRTLHTHYNSNAIAMKISGKKVMFNFFGGLFILLTIFTALILLGLFTTENNADPIAIATNIVNLFVSPYLSYSAFRETKQIQ